MTETWERRAVSAEINGRRVNEAIERGGQGSSCVFVCECGHLGCNATVELSIAEYEAVRTAFDRFLVLPGHVIDAVDHVVENRGGYLVVVKREGEPKRMVREADSREA
ncbi:MAG TPA: hypothetical protein VHR18_06325 [Solirubrobacterales bacterium]|nr:hypothetical protein [Solirubrobacterales bacterium]